MIGFDEARLLSAAARQFGMRSADEVLEPEFRPAFCALLTSLREQAQLSSVGSWRVGARLMTALGQRLELARFERETPGLAQQEIGAPIFITGLPRSSTALLHNLLARVPGLWSPRLWELQRPIPPARIDEHFVDRQIRATEVLLEQLYAAAPELRGPCPLTPTSPDSCSWLFRASFSSLHHACTWYLPDYVEFMLDAELGHAYHDHRRFVRVLAHRHRLDEHDSPRVVLEDAFHLWHLDALFASYADATVLRIAAPREHVIDGLTRSCWTLHAIDSKCPRPPKRLREYCERIVDAGLVADRRVRGRGRIIDIDETELREDPLALLAKLGPRLGLQTSERALSEARRWLLDQRLLGPGASPSRFAATSPPSIG